MSWQAKIVALFPATHLMACLSSAIYLVMNPGVCSFLLLVSAIYIFPVLTFRIHNFIWPLSYGEFDFSSSEYVPWWGAHQFQLLFIAAPWIEAVLALVPGLYSFWLRRWGSVIGSGVYWTPAVEILDRSTLIIGDGVIVGHRAGFYSHYIRKNKHERQSLYVNSITIGANTLIGGGCRFGPGVKVGVGSRLNILSDIYPNVSLPEGYRTHERQVVKESVET
jgi:hypothetical protein